MSISITDPPANQVVVGSFTVQGNYYCPVGGSLLDEVRRQGMAAEFVPHQSLRKGSSPVVGRQPLPTEA